MVLTSVFYDGPVTETDRAKNRAGAPDYGVYGADDFKIITHPSLPYALTVKAGKAHGHGITDTAAADQVVQCATLSGSGAVRYDLIVVRRNWQPLLGGPSTLAAIQGGSTTPNVNTLRLKTPGIEDDQPIALVKWQGNQNTPAQIIDLRCWAGNGGMIAANTLALDYLARPGADVLIGSSTWRYSLGDNSVWGWVEDSAIGLFGAGSPRVGSAPPQGAKVFAQTGTLVTNADPSGYGSITFPKPFPNGVLYVRADQGDASVNTQRATVISLPVAGTPDWPSPVTLTRFTYAVQASNGSKIPGALHRADWLAIGW